MTHYLNGTEHQFPAIGAADVRIIGMTSEGFSVPEIASELGTSQHEVRLDLRRLQDRLGAVNPASLVRRAYELRILKVGYP